MKKMKKYVMAYKRLPGHGETVDLYELDYDKWQKATQDYKVVNGIPFEKPAECEVEEPEAVAAPEVSVVDMEVHHEVAELKPEDEYALLKQKGWAKLNSEERAEYKRLKAICES